MKPLSINASSDLRRNLSMRVYRIACAFANCIHTPYFEHFPPSEAPEMSSLIRMTDMHLSTPLST
ncbi:hypothetical protein ALC60_03755 [Trachymyrmex zeteki]|uniref:Uncharacterized protein n=1 Tax=Mycetomoellerius zeteki TaxID=64791 RepID=A0A151XA44_9HYME|nr:hypothetical protein ALC60_03755 [Trachymyrmex zeteki]